MKLLCKNKITMLGNKKPKGDKPRAPTPSPIKPQNIEIEADDLRITTEEIARIFGVPPQMLEQSYHIPLQCLEVEIAALEFLRKSAQRYLDEMAPGKFTVKVDLNKNTVAGSNPAGGD